MAGRDRFYNAAAPSRILTRNRPAIQVVRLMLSFFPSGVTAVISIYVTRFSEAISRNMRMSWMTESLLAGVGLGERGDGH